MKVILITEQTIREDNVESAKSIKIVTAANGSMTLTWDEATQLRAGLLKAMPFRNGRPVENFSNTDKRRPYR